METCFSKTLSWSCQLLTSCILLLLSFYSLAQIFEKKGNCVLKHGLGPVADIQTRRFMMCCFHFLIKRKTIFIYMKHEVFGCHRSSFRLMYISRLKVNESAFNKIQMIDLSLSVFLLLFASRESFILITCFFILFFFELFIFTLE